MHESFHVCITYEDKLRQFGIIPSHDQFTNCINHEVWEDGSYFFTLVPSADQDMNFKWKDRNTLSAVDGQLVSAIGQANRRP